MQGFFPDSPQLGFLWVYDMSIRWQPIDDNPWGWDSEEFFVSFLLRKKSFRSHSSFPFFVPTLNGPMRESFPEAMTTNIIFSENKELEENIRVLTNHLGPIPSDFEQGVSLMMEVFILLEGSEIAISTKTRMWCHSLRTGYMAALISASQRVDQRMVWQAFVGGLLHDIGILIFLAQLPHAFTTVVEMARSHGQDLGNIEKQIFGTTHAESGAKFLERWGVDKDLLNIVEFHDEPFQVANSEFCSLTAVYLANILEGGGMAQDGDGVIAGEGEAYVRSLGLWDALPIWQEWSRRIHHVLVKSE